MQSALLNPLRPAMWDITQAPASKGGAVVRLGKRHVRIAEIESVALEEVQDRNTQGAVLGAVAFMCFATLLSYLVIDAGWRPRFLLGSGFLSFLGCTAFIEMAKLKTLSLYEMFVTLKSGEKIVFTSMDRADIETLALRITALQARGG